MTAAWPEVSLGEIVELKYGKSLPKAKRTGSGFGVYGSNGEVGRHELALTSGPTIVVGRKGSHGAVNFSSDSCWPIDTTYFVDHSCTTADLDWLKYRLKGLRLDELNQAAAVPGLNREDAYRRKLMLPPIEEQRRIATLLDAADELRTKRHQALAKLDNLTQAIFIDMFGDPARNTKGLRVQTLGELGEWRSGGTPPRNNSDHFVGPIPWYSSGDLKSEFLSEASESINQRAIESTSAKAVPVGALLLGMYDTAALKSGIATTASSCNQAVAFARLDESVVSTRYVYAAIQLGKDHFKRNQRGVRQKNLNLTMIREIPIPVPAREAQREFEAHLQHVDVLRTTAMSSDDHLDTLFASLQQRAFAGEL
ncbi:MAG: restriction endonuclease subunit S [Acidimicrobiia bacterium]|nr:restriction endonuclease subunit S [Acidimicrobiia bacterium]